MAANRPAANTANVARAYLKRNKFLYSEVVDFTHDIRIDPIFTMIGSGPNAKRSKLTQAALWLFDAYISRFNDPWSPFDAVPA